MEREAKSGLGTWSRAGWGSARAILLARWLMDFIEEVHGDYSQQYIEQDDEVSFGQADFKRTLKVYVEEYL